MLKYFISAFRVSLFSSLYFHSPTGYPVISRASERALRCLFLSHRYSVFRQPWNFIHTWVMTLRKIAHSKRGVVHFTSVSNIRLRDFLRWTIQDVHATPLMSLLEDFFLSHVWELHRCSYRLVRGETRSRGCRMELSYIFSYYWLLCWILPSRTVSYP